MSLLWTLIIGFVAGLLARAIHPGNDKLSLFKTALLGIGGSFLAKYAGQFIGLYQPGDKAGLIASTIGAIILLSAYSFYQRSKIKHVKT
jgi:uncharacterized membrane protein YeaQ/YmgE (transglycosylase-associated protein family)